MTFVSSVDSSPDVAVRNPIAVFLMKRGPVGVTHVGLYYRHSNGDLYRFDYLDDDKYKNQPFETGKRVSWWSECTSLTLLEQATLVATLEAFGDAPRDLPYGLNARGFRFDPDTNDFINIRPEKRSGGLTCASFLHVILEGLEIETVQLDTWEARTSDLSWALRAIIDNMEGLRKKLSSAAFAATKHFYRLRPSEFAASLVADAADVPLPFTKAAPLGKAIEESI